MQIFLTFQHKRNVKYESRNIIFNVTNQKHVTNYLQKETKITKVIGMKFSKVAYDSNRRKKGKFGISFRIQNHYQYISTLY